jgi:hypothetical protein
MLTSSDFSGKIALKRRLCGKWNRVLNMRIVIRMATITGGIAGIAIDLLDSFKARRIAVNIAKLPEWLQRWSSGGTA